MIRHLIQGTMQHVRDALHEHEIRRLGKQCAEAMDAGDSANAAQFWAAQSRAIKARSAQQVARMEQSKGLSRGR